MRRRRGQFSVSPPGHVATADREIGAVLGVGDERRQHSRIVRQIRIHLHADLGATVDRRAQSGSVGGAEPGLARPANDPDPAERRRSISSASSAVPSGLASSTIKHVGLGHGQAHLAAQPLDVAGFVVGRNDHGDTHDG